MIGDTLFLAIKNPAKAGFFVQATKTYLMPLISLNFKR